MSYLLLASYYLYVEIKRYSLDVLAQFVLSNKRKYSKNIYCFRADEFKLLI